MRRVLVFTSVALVACNAILGIEDLPSEPAKLPDAAPTNATEASVPDASTDAPPDVFIEPDADAEPPPDCNLLADFGTPEIVDSLSTAEDEGSARLSDDELTVYFDAQRSGDWKLMRAKRSSRTDPWGDIEPIEALNTVENEYMPTVTSDGQRMYFERNVAGHSNIWTAARGVDGGFDNASKISNLNSTNYTANPFTRGDGNDLWFVTSNDSDPPKIYEAINSGSGFASGPVSATSIGHGEQAPVISRDGLVLYFASTHLGDGGDGQLEIYVTTRTSKTASFSKPNPVTALNSPLRDYPTWLSRDGCRIYFASNRVGGSGGQDIYYATRPH